MVHQLTENAWKKYGDKSEIFAFCEAYRKFISDCKTERECVAEMVKRAKQAGFQDLNAVVDAGTELKAGDKSMQTIWERHWRSL